jgi:hypothetical protein
MVPGTIKQLVRSRGGSPSRPGAGNDGGEEPGRTMVSGQAHSKIQGLFHSPLRTRWKSPLTRPLRSRKPGGTPLCGVVAHSREKRAAIGPSPRGRRYREVADEGFCHGNETIRATFRTALVVTEVESLATLAEGGIHPALRKRESGDLGCGPVRRTGYSATERGHSA